MFKIARESHCVGIFITCHSQAEYPAVPGVGAKLVCVPTHLQTAVPAGCSVLSHFQGETWLNCVRVAGLVLEVSLLLLPESPGSGQHV